uniref:Cre-sdha-1 protein n=1 Tax=Triatoma infestans TaxID=30076 RepID=A0A171AN00_TRIIF
MNTAHIRLTMTKSYAKRCCSI